MNVLAIGAHYDDIELGCSGTLIKHVRKGDNVTMIVVSNSDYKDPNGLEVRSADQAYSEGLDAANIIGANLISLNYETLNVPYDDSLATQLVSYINKLDIDIIYSHWVNDLHRDHQYTGKSALMAGKRVKSFLMYRSNYFDCEKIFRGNFYSDISDVIEDKIRVIKAHKSELKRVRYKWIDFFRKMHENAGEIIGVKYAESFEIIRYLI